MISGLGFAIAKIIASLFIDFTISDVSTFHLETPIKISLQATAVSNHQIIHSLLVGSSKQAVFVIFVSISFTGFKSFLPG
jgi:hypothetical protein